MKPLTRRPLSYAWVSTRRSLFSCALAGALLTFALSACGEAPAPTPTFAGEAAWDYLVKQCAFGPRVPATPAHDSTVVFIARTLEGHGATVRLQRFHVDDPYGSRQLRLTNIIGSFHTDASKRIILCAHYDTRPWADQEADTALHNTAILGANDGASGAAILLELAAILEQRAPDVGVDLVFFDGEDYGKEGDLKNYLLGSRHFAANLGGYRPVCGVLLDIVGGVDARIMREGNSQAYATTINDYLFARAATMGLTVFADEVGPPMLDDHVPLLRAGIPTVDLIGLPWEHWHTLGDVPENCSKETLRQVGSLVTDFIYNYTF